ncbi:MAG: GNAT family N-acetyltransferase [Actinomycetota bacterium]
MDGLESRGIELRPAAQDDDDLVRRVLALAADWRADDPSIAVAELPAAYYAGWGRPDDLGMWAFDGIVFAGGAYARRVGPAAGTYGYVEPDLFELTIGIEATHRGTGLGRLVLEALKAQTMQRGVRGLSLSVARDNSVGQRLYRAANFAVVDERSTDLLMRWSWG